MDLFDVLSLIGGLALFLYGMNLMGEALEKRAGSGLKNILSKMTDNPAKGFALGLLVTAVIQSSSATTVMVVGFVNSGIMALRQAIGVIMGANVGTTITSWLLSLTGIEGSNIFVQLLKPSSFTPVLALAGIALVMLGGSSNKRKSTGLIFLGFAILMTGMSIMSGSVEGLKHDENFTRILLVFSNPILGVLAGAVLTAIIQSSSASVGILQALCATDAVPYSVALPIILGQNIGTCITSLLSCIGANTNARRAAFVHLYFNIIGTAVTLAAFYGLNAIFRFEFVNWQANEMGIAIVHTCFNVICTGVLLPFSKQLEKLAILTVPDKKDKKAQAVQLLDERLLNTPPIAVARSREVAVAMAREAVDSLKLALNLLWQYDAKSAAAIRGSEDNVDKMEDRLGSYLVSISTRDLSDDDSREVARLLHLIGDFERISDHAVHLVETTEELREKKAAFSPRAEAELRTLCKAVAEALDASLAAVAENDLNAAVRVDPLEQVIDVLTEDLKKRHIARLRKGKCTIEMGFILTDLLGYLERVSDHCASIAGCILEMAHEGMDIHSYMHTARQESRYGGLYEAYSKQYALPAGEDA